MEKGVLGPVQARQLLQGGVEVLPAAVQVRRETDGLHASQRRDVRGVPHACGKQVLY